MSRFVETSLISAFIILLISCQHSSTEQAEPRYSEPKPEYAIVVHGGAGVMANLATEKADSIKTLIKIAVNKGIAILDTGGTSLDAVLETIKILENHPYFNAGKGSVYTSTGTIEMDASIMDGQTLNAGAVAGITSIKNPIIAAKEVMLNSKHVFLTGEGALQFAQEQGLEIVDPEYFYTPARFDSYKKKSQEEEKYGTVGCVAIDKHGNIVAGTSTGGTFYKRYGRVGDSPIIGAGTYANNKTCGVSCTGTGEYFIRLNIAHDISALMEYKNLDLQAAADEVIQKKLTALDGNGGVIALDREGNIAFSFNTPGMIRGFKNSKGEEGYGIYR